MAKITITIRAQRAFSFIDGLAQAIEKWPDAKKDRFSDHWRGLEANGAELVDFLFVNGTLHAAISDDFRRAMAEFGVAT